MENWRKFVKEAASEEEIENEITSSEEDGAGDPEGILPLEGGAAGLEAIKAHIEKELGDRVPDDFDLEEFLDGLENVGKSNLGGDYIQDDGAEIEITKEGIEDIVEGIDIFLDAQDEILGEKKKRKKRKRKKKKKKGKKDACYHKVRARYSV